MSITASKSNRARAGIRAIFLVALLLTLFVAANAAAQSRISTTIVDSSHGDLTETFTFASLPRPLQECWVDLTVQCRTCDTRSGDRTFYVWGTAGAVRLLGDTIFTWPAPIQRGETITRRFGFVPLMSGTSWIIVSGAPPASILGDPGPRFAVCLDESGVVQYLDSAAPDEYVHCGGVRTCFLGRDEDSLTISYPERNDWTATFEHLPQPGDTCEVVFRIYSEQPWPTGDQIRILASGFSVVTLPTPVDYVVTPERAAVISFTVLADSLVGAKGLRVQIISRREDQTIFGSKTASVALWYGVDRRLKYAAPEGLRYQATTEEKAAIGKTRGVLEQYYIDPNGTVSFRHGDAKAASLSDR